MTEEQALHRLLAALDDYESKLKFVRRNIRKRPDDKSEWRMIEMQANALVDEFTGPFRDKVGEIIRELTANKEEKA